MPNRNLILAITFAVASLFSIRSSNASLVAYTDIDAFRAAVGDLRVIDFETLPDGTPSYDGALITPAFNYTAQGVTFSSPHPTLAITGYASGTGYPLTASNHDTSHGRNWIVADLVTPARAVGIVFPGITEFSVYGENDRFLSTLRHGGSGSAFFSGFVSDDPIFRAIGDRASSGEAWGAFHFAPVPEPPTVLLMLMGVLALLRRVRH